MNCETELKVQAYLDGELSPAESREVKEALEQDAEARMIFEELRTTKEWVAGNELEVKLPETREFYWSKIEGDILRRNEPARNRAEQSRIPWWLRIAAPVAGAAALVMLVVSTKLASDPEAEPFYAQEIETPLEETSVFSFYSESAGMTVVWVEMH